MAAHQGREAAAEFQKILDHRGIVLNSAIGALARLELARAKKIASIERTGEEEAAILEKIDQRWPGGIPTLGARTEEMQEDVIISSVE